MFNKRTHFSKKLIATGKDSIYEQSSIWLEPFRSDASIENDQPVLSDVPDCCFLDCSIIPYQLYFPIRFLKKKKSAMTAG